MRLVDLRVFNISSSKLNEAEMRGFLKFTGVPDWTTDAPSDGEELIEAAGKLCYKSFAVELNANLTRVRENNNEGFILNLIKSGHGSVLEHVSETFALVNPTRVLTHELVRHRIASYSQESLRFVRLEDLGARYPAPFKEPWLQMLRDRLMAKGIDVSELTEEVVKAKFVEVFEYLEQVQIDFATLLHLDEIEEFDLKKALTSACRRMAPMGLSTSIMVSANLRQWRLMIQKRTGTGAEEEIREAFWLIWSKLRVKYPNVFADSQEGTIKDEIPEIYFKYNAG